MKSKLLILSCFFVALLFIPEMRANAEEITNYGVDILCTSYAYNADGTSCDGYPRTEILAQYDSFSPLYVYYYQSSDVPTSGSGSDEIAYYILSLYEFSDDVKSFSCDSETWFYCSYIRSSGVGYPLTGYTDLTINGDNVYRLNQFYELTDFISGFQNDSLDYNVAIDWDNAVYNESIGYLQNVMLKEDGLTHKDFEITWANNNGQYMSEDWRIQIGYYTRFQETLFGDRKLYTNLEYINWADSLYYSSGKWSCNVDDLYSVIPNCNHPAYTGNFYLRIIHVDNKTGVCEYGPWGQLSWVINRSGDDGGRFVFSEYLTISSSNVLENDGVTDFYDEEYVIDTNSDTSQKYVINTSNGSIDSTSTDIYNSIYTDTGTLDLSQAGTYFTSGITSLFSSINNLPQLVSKVISFLPSEIILFLGLSIVACLILRIFGR